MSTKFNQKKSGAQVHKKTHEELHTAGITHVHRKDTGNSYAPDADMRSHTHGAELHSRVHGTGSHRHVHSMEEKKAVLNRLSKAIGHLEAVKRMVERDEDCSEVLIQLAAVRSAINNAGKVVLKNHINHCIVEAVEENDKEAIELLNQAIDKFMK